MFWDEPDDGDSFGVPEEFISEAYSNPEIQEVLSQHGANRRDLAALADRVKMTSIPERSQAKALNNPELVHFLLANSDRAETKGETVRNVHGITTSLTIQAWLNTNPGGAPPR